MRILTGKAERTGIWKIEAGDDAQESGFAAARRTKQGKELALHNRERHIVQRRHAREAAREMRGFDDGGPGNLHGGSM